MINIEFHKRPLSKAILKRDLEYVIQYAFFYDEVIDQRIIVVDDDKTSANRLQILANLEYNGKIYHIPKINGGLILNNIKDKVKKNEELSEYEQYVFSILPLTNHCYNDEKKLVEEICNMTQELNISEENRDAITLCQMILIELYIDDDSKKKELMEVITMTTSYIEKYERERMEQLTQQVTQQVTEQVTEQVTQQVTEQITERERKKAEQMINNERKRANAAEKAKNTAEKLLKEVVENKNNKIDEKILKQILLVTTKM